jgi:hypothetical protein
MELSIGLGILKNNYLKCLTMALSVQLAHVKNCCATTSKEYYT